MSAATILQQQSVPVAPVQTTDQLLRDQHLASLNWWHELEHADLGTHQYAGFPYHFSHSVLTSTQASPQLGQHARSILETELGLDQTTIDTLFAAGVSGEDF